MKKKKRIITIAGLLLIAVVGATFAYYTSNTSFENVFNAGKYKITLTEVFESPDNWVPGETVPKTVTAKNDGTVPAAVRISYTEQWLKEIDGVETDITSQVSPNPAIINFANQNDWTLSNGYYYYKYILEPTDETSSFISGVTLDPNLNSVTCTGEGIEKTCEAQNPASGAKYKLTFTIQTVQYDQYQNVWNTNVDLKTEKIIIEAIKSGDTLAKGDKVKLKWNNNEEEFKVISVSSSLVGILAENNLNPTTGLQGEDGVKYGVPFSSEQYWGSSVTSMNVVDIYDPTMNKAPGNSDYSVAYYVETYIKNLRDAGFNIASGRILSQYEISEPRSFYVDEGEDSWLGSVYQKAYNLFLDNSDTNMSACAYTSNKGVRPYIFIYLSDIE